MTFLPFYSNLQSTLIHYIGQMMKNLKQYFQNQDHVFFCQNIKIILIQFTSFLSKKNMSPIKIIKAKYFNVLRSIFRLLSAQKNIL